MSYELYSINTTIPAQINAKYNDTDKPYFCNIVTFTRLSTVLLLRAGYVLIQIGSIPVNDVYSIMLHNILDITVTIGSYGLIGYKFFYGKQSLGGFIGATSSLSEGYPNLDMVIHGFSASLIGSAVITTMLAGRVLPMSAAITSFLYSGLIQPIVMHWVWHDKGWMVKRKMSKTMFSVKDHSGGMTVHLTAGVAALWGSVCLGRRLLKLKDIPTSSLGTASPGMTFIGYLFVFLGLTSFSLPTQKYEQNRIPADFMGIILNNSLMALSSGLWVIMMQCFCFGRVTGYWTLLKCLQGSLAGLVTLSSGIDVYDHLVAFFIAGTGSVVFYCVTIILERTFYEDYCNVIPVHVFCALVGGIFPPILGKGENLGFSISSYGLFLHTTWQIICGLTIVAWSTVFFLPLFIFLQCLGLLANRREELNHQRSLNVLKNVDSRRRFWRIFSFSEFAPFVEPGAETRSKESLDILKSSNELRRQLLENAMSKKQEVKGFKAPSIIQTPVVPIEEIVKDMGILEAERYPASYQDDDKRKIISEKLLYDTVIEPLPLTMQAHKTATGDYVHEGKIVEADVHDGNLIDEKKERNEKKKVSPRRRSRTIRRKRRLKRLDSDLSFKKCQEYY